MATLYVENVPRELYEALRQRAKSHRRSIAAELITLLEEQVPSAAELRRRRGVVKRLRRLQASNPEAGPSLASEAMVREDRER
ncbi:MAG TPA: Arc family DNA-binding protein [Terriglobales bacterium]|nr:Arc family DNA-binding protein [Terriglobales bacterium]